MCRNANTDFPEADQTEKSILLDALFFRLHVCRFFLIIIRFQRLANLPYTLLKFAILAVCRSDEDVLAASGAVIWQEEESVMPARIQYKVGNAFHAW